MNGPWNYHLPRVARLLAVALVLALIAAIVISYLNQYGFIHRAGEVYPEYRMSHRLVSVTEHIRHLQAQGDRYLFSLKASRDELYDDGHHELKDVVLEVYGDNQQSQGWVRAEHCVYDPKQGLVIFKTRVVANAWDRLSLVTDRLTYHQDTGVIQTDQPVEIEQRRLRGRVVGVEVRTRPGQEQVVLKQDVNVVIEPGGQSGSPASSELVRIRSQSAYSLKSESAIHLVGNVVLSQGMETLTADRMTAFLDGHQRVHTVKATGRVLMQSRSGRRTSQVQAETMEFSFDQDQRLRRAVASGDAAANVVHAQQVRQVRAPRIEAEFVPTGTASVTVSRLVGDHGRVEVRFSPAGASALANSKSRSLGDRLASEEKTLTADWVELSYRKEGRELDRALASGQAVLVLKPQSMGREAERKTIRADRMEIEFYDDGTLANAFTAQGHVRVEFEPLGPGSAKPVRVTTSQTLVAQIDRRTHEFTQLTQSGDFHFAEGDRQASSQMAVYDAATHILSLRGGEPVMWDTRGRLRAEQVDINMETGESLARGRVHTTYYNQEATQRTVPFLQRQAPIFIAADQAEVKQRINLAIYTGKVRVWQDDHYVTAERVELYGKERMMVAIGQVRSGFYQAPERTQDADPAGMAPVFVKAQRMTYLDVERLVRYEHEVHLQQGRNRLRADRLTVFLQRDVNELERAVAEGQVVIAEPERRAYGDQAVYTAADERVVLTGQPAHVEDERTGIVQRGPRLTYLAGDDKVIVGDQGGAQRVRSVRKIQ